MKTKISLFALSAVAAALMAGCGSSGDAPATPAQQKAFSGGPPPADYMNGVNSGAKLGEEAAKKAQAQHGP